MTEQDYHGLLDGLRSREEKLGRRSNALAACKLAFFAGIIAAVWFTVRDGAGALETAGIVLSVLSYLAAVKADEICRKRISALQARIKVCENELAYLKGDFSPFDDGSGYIDIRHEYSYDMDIFGPRSLFNRINRTVTLKGRDALARKLTHLPSDPEEIARRQEAVSELAAAGKWRLDFLSNPGIGKGLDLLAESYLENGKLTVGTSRKSLLRMGVSAVSASATIIFLICWIAGVLPWPYFWGMFVIQLTVSAASARRTGQTAGQTGELFSECKAYLGLLELIGRSQFTSPVLKELQQGLFKDRQGSIEAVRKLASLLNLFDQRGNFVMYMLLNGILMYDMVLSVLFDRWCRKYLPRIKGWTGHVAEFDALTSLATYASNHPENTGATILDSSSDVIISAKGIYHPFLWRNSPVPNSFTLKRHNIAIVTGANMAGKSTFLRTIGISFVLACNGAPVCAEKFAFVPVALFSSMRTTDNLSADISYFQAELLRLGQMLEKIRSGGYTLVILDEILKGTNSADKLNGSAMVLEELKKYDVSGIVATHDLGLAEAGENDSAVFSNYRFEIELSDEIRYTYRISPGIARNMNASYLIRKILDRQEIRPASAR